MVELEIAGIRAKMMAHSETLMRLVITGDDRRKSVAERSPTANVKSWKRKRFE